MNILDLHADSFFRPADWRWQRATWLREHPPGEYPRDPNDVYVRKARQFQDARDRCRGAHERRWLAESWPDMLLAYRIYSGDDAPAKRELEARLLTGVPLERVGQTMGIGTNAMTWYEALFFNVRGRLDDRSWIYRKAIGPLAYEAFSERDLDALLKIIAYHFGEVALEQFLCVFPGAREAPTCPEEVTGAWDAASRALLSRRGLLSLLTMKPGDNYQKLQLLELAQAAREADRADGSQSQDVLHQHIAAAARALPWGVGASGHAGPGVRAIGPLKEGEKGPGELRIGQKMRRLMGEEIPSTMPPPCFRDREQNNEDG